MKLRNYQKNAINKISSDFLQNKKRAYILGDEMGLGKTPQALKIAQKVSKKHKNVLLIAPGYLEEKWKNEIKKWLGKIDFNIYIYNFRSATIKRKEIIKNLYDIMLIDEGHALKDFKSQRTSAILGNPNLSKDFLPIIKRSRFILNITGTPVPNRVGEIYPFLWAIRKEEIRKMTYIQFLYKYADFVEQNKYGIIHKGIKNEKILKEIIGDILIRRKIENVKKEIPEKIIDFIDIKFDKNYLSKEQRNLLDQFESEKLKKYKNIDGELLYQYLKLEPSFEKLVEIGHLQARFKIPIILSYLKNIIENYSKKFILVCYHRDIANVYTKQLKKYHKNVVLISSNINKKDRFKICEKLNIMNECIIVSTINSISEGLDLDGFDRMYFAEICWQPHKIEQTQGRIRRIKNLKKVFYTFFRLNSGVEKLKYRAINKKIKIQEKLNLR